MICSALMQPRFDYGCNSWYRGLDCSLKHKLQTAQNKIMRMILGEKQRFHIGFDSFKKLNWLNVPKRIDYLTVCHFYNIYHGVAPPYMMDVVRTSDLHNHRTRNSSLNFVLPRVKSQGALTFKFNGIKLWNNLPEHIRLSAAASSFKTKTKILYMNEMGAQESGRFIYL